MDVSVPVCFLVCLLISVLQLADKNPRRVPNGVLQQQQQQQHEGIKAQFVLINTKYAMGHEHRDAFEWHSTRRSPIRSRLKLQLSAVLFKRLNEPNMIVPFK